MSRGAYAPIDLDSPLARALEAWADGIAVVTVKAVTAKDGTTRGNARFEDGGVVAFIVGVPLDDVTVADLAIEAER